MLQLRNRHSNSSVNHDYATIRAEIDPLSDPQGQPSTLHELREIEIGNIEKEIKDVSAALTSRYKSQIVDVPIHLTIYRQGQFDLTLYDLPGIYYGDKHAEELITKMWKRYISKPNALILYTIPCTVDLNTSQALSLAREVDPKGERTLTVATKIDLRVKSSFADNFAKLAGSLGIICVRNRSKEEIESGLSFEDCKLKERQEFEAPDLFFIPQESRGIDSLILKLVQI